MDRFSSAFQFQAMARPEVSNAYARVLPTKNRRSMRARKLTVEHGAPWDSRGKQRPSLAQNGRRLSMRANARISTTLHHRHTKKAYRGGESPFAHLSGVGQIVDQAADRPRHVFPRANIGVPPSITTELFGTAPAWRQSASA